MKRCRRSEVAVLLGLLTFGVAAEELSYDFTVCTSGRRIPVEASADVVSFGVENWGVVASSTTKMFEQASTHCVGYLQVIAGKPVGKGIGKWALVGGDSGVGEWEYPAAGEPSWTWLAGSGKLKGVSGKGSFREVFSAPVADVSMGQGCRRDWGTVVLP